MCKLLQLTNTVSIELIKAVHTHWEDYTRGVRQNRVKLRNGADIQISIGGVSLPLIIYSQIKSLKHNRIKFLLGKPNRKDSNKRNHQCRLFE